MTIKNGQQVQIICGKDKGKKGEIIAHKIRPIYSENLLSNSLTKGPSEDIHSVSMHSFRYILSLSPRSGLLTGIGLIIYSKLCFI